MREQVRAVWKAEKFAARNLAKAPLFRQFETPIGNGGEPLFVANAAGLFRACA